MSKYTPLNEYLKHVPGNHVPMRFGDIEKILGFKLPSSSRHHRAWWSNNPSNNVMTKAWIDAGFVTIDVDLSGEKLVFQRAFDAHASTQDPVITPVESKKADMPKTPRRNPLFGALKGLLVIKSEAALTQGFDEDWNAYDH
jgi:hypothetical protein